MDAKPDPAPVPPPAIHDDWEYYRAVIGDSNAEYYLEKFRRFAVEGAFRPDWNWAAFFFGNLWVLHRKQRGLFFLYFVVALALIIAAGAAARSLEVGLACWAVLSFAVFPVYANGLYYLHVRNLVENVKRRWPIHFERLVFLGNDGLPAGEKRNISWPEWGVVALVVGVVAAVAAPQYADYPLRAKFSEAILSCSELKLQVAEFAYRSGRLPVSVDELKNLPPRGKWVKSMDLQQDATIVATLQGEGKLEGKTLVFRPTLEGGKVTWVCGSPDVETKHLPVSCRERLEPVRATN